MTNDNTASYLCSMILSITKYNLWANKKITSYILHAGEATADKEIPSSFSSIRKTLHHMWDAEVIWLTRLNGNFISSWPSTNFKGTLKEACDELLKNSSAIIAFAEGCADFNKKLIYKTTDLKTYTQTIEQIIHHIVNHQSYHRGQLITMLRQAGFTDVGSTDMIRYFREVDMDSQLAN